MNRLGIVFYIVLAVFILASCADGPRSAPMGTDNQDSIPMGWVDNVDADTSISMPGQPDTRIDANIVYNRPDTMLLGESTEITLVLGKDDLYSHNELLDGEFEDTDKLVNAASRLTEEVGAVLRGANFEISPDEEVRQMVLNEKVRWTWSVKPKSEGTHKLSLILYNYIESEGKETKQQLKALKDDIYVYSPGPEWYEKLWNFILDNMEWILTLLVIPLFLQLKKYFKKKKY